MKPKLGLWLKMLVYFVLFNLNQNTLQNQENKKHSFLFVYCISKVFSLLYRYPIFMVVLNMNLLIITTLLVTFFMFFYVPVTFCINPLYGTCPTELCGTVTITYPFHIVGKQKSHCGYPGFEVSCHNEKIPYVNISGDTYVILNMSYQTQSFQVMNSAVYDAVTNGICITSINNMTLQDSIFRFADVDEDKIILLNCESKSLGSNEHDRLLGSNCKTVAVFDGDKGLTDLEKECSGVKSVPYDGLRNGSSIIDVLRRGILLNWIANNCSACIDTGGQCGFNGTTNEFKCYCPDHDHAYNCVPKKKNTGVMVGSIAGATVGILLLILSVVFICARRRKSTNNFSALSSRGRTENQNVETFLKAYSTLAVKRYTYADIRKMTNSFKDKLGEGGYGSVYKGQFRDDRFVAVKLLKHLKADGEDFINEVASISRTNHVNIVTLLGFCFEGKKRALIYDFLSNGSLDKYMYGAVGRQSLSVEIRFNIAVGIARGLDYLHRGCNTRILHFDIKPHNILLDDGFCPKISDFGLAKLVCVSKDSSVSMLEARGTIGYIAPEVFLRNFGGVSNKSDVYSYGMMVLDMVCGRNSKPDVVQSSNELYFPHWIYNQLEVEAEVSVHEIVNDEERRLERKMIIVSLWCIQMYPTKRPSMSRVGEMLEGCLESLEMPPKPDSSSSQGLACDFSTSQLPTSQL